MPYDLKSNLARIPHPVNAGASSIRSDLVILKTAQIEGDVHYDALTIEQGAQVDGRFAHREAGSTPLPAGEDGEPRLLTPSLADALRREVEQGRTTAAEIARVLGEEAPSC